MKTMDIDEKVENEIRERFRGVFELGLINEIIEKGRIQHVPEGEVLMDLGKYIKFMPIVLSGAVRILREDKEGNELFLYYLNGGDACAMSMSCCLQNKKSEIRAISEAPSTICMLPIPLMEEWLEKYHSWKMYVFESYNSRFDELLTTIDSIAFLKMDERLLKYLLDKKQQSGSYVITKTHQEIANELNTSRVVISRLLKQLEKEERITLHRNRIEIL
ncbi:MAG: Crp/Fnr family transcriptional regulator [Bacteroidota bacterium]